MARKSVSHEDDFDKCNAEQIKIHKLKLKRRRFKVGDDVVPVLSIYADDEKLHAGKIIGKKRINGKVMYIVKFTISVITCNHTHPMGKDINIFSQKQLLPAQEALVIAYKRQLRDCQRYHKHLKSEMGSYQEMLKHEAQKAARLKKLIRECQSS